MKNSFVLIYTSPSPTYKWLYSQEKKKFNDFSSAFINLNLRTKTKLEILRSHHFIVAIKMNTTITMQHEAS